jgi:hypothetical protein
MLPSPTSLLSQLIEISRVGPGIGQIRGRHWTSRDPFELGSPVTMMYGCCLVHAPKNCVASGRSIGVDVAVVVLASVLTPLWGVWSQEWINTAKL